MVEDQRAGPHDQTQVADHRGALVQRVCPRADAQRKADRRRPLEGNPGQKKWDQWWCDFIKSKASAAGKTIYTTTMFDKKNWDPVVNNPGTYSYVEGSKVGSRWTEKGQTQYDVAVGCQKICCK